MKLSEIRLITFDIGGSSEQFKTQVYTVMVDVLGIKKCFNHQTPERGKQAA